MNKSDSKSKNSYQKLIPLSAKHLIACFELDQIALHGLWTKKQWEKELTDSKRLCFGFLRRRAIGYGG